MKLTTGQLRDIILEELNEMLSPELKAKLDSLFATGDTNNARSGLELADIYGIPITVQMLSPFLKSPNVEDVIEGIEMAFENGIELQYLDINQNYKIIKAIIRDPNAHPKVLNIFGTHDNKTGTRITSQIKTMIAKHPNTPPKTLAHLGMLNTSMNSRVVTAALKNPNIPVEVLKHHANSIFGYWRNLSRNILELRNVDIKPYQEPRDITLDDVFGRIDDENSYEF